MNTVRRLVDRCCRGSQVTTSVISCWFLILIVACDSLAPEEKIEMTVVPRQLEVVAGDSAFFDVAIVNTSPGTVTLTSPNSCLFDILVENTEGDVVDRYIGGCFTAVTDHEISPGIFASFAFVWVTSEGQQPGEYSVRAVMLLFTKEPRFSEPAQVRVLESRGP